MQAREDRSASPVESDMRDSMFSAASSWAGQGARQCTLPMADTTMWWVEAGQGMPLVLLHGYGGSARWWTRNLHSLAKVRRVYVPDLPGFTRSRMRVRFTLEGAVDRLAIWMAASGVECADIMGHSMGGMVALLLAARHPERIRSLVLCAPAGIPFTSGLVGIALRALRSRGSGDPRFTAIVVAGSLRTGPRVMWQAVQEIRSVDVLSELRAVKAPSLILWGDRDHLLPVSGARIMTEAIAGARLIVVPGAGHNLMYEQADLVNQAAVDFFSEERDITVQSSRPGDMPSVQC